MKLSKWEKIASPRQKGFFKIIFPHIDNFRCFAYNILSLIKSETSGL
jgi:hypothetical protein